MNRDELKYYTIASRLFTEFNSDAIINKLETLVEKSPLYVIKEKIKQKTTHIDYSLPANLKGAIIDFEGHPIFLVGIMITDKILTFYIKNYTHIERFYFLILKVMSILKELSLFSFSDYEKEALLKIYTYLEMQGFDLTDYNFIKDLTIVNLQENKYEALTEAIYSIIPADDSIITTGDTLFRNLKLIPKLFSAEKMEILIEHNRNCLSNETVILLKRWLKYYQMAITNKNGDRYGEKN
jgi:hypothetical protein